jgi:signal transduction histidine kinase
MQIQAPELIGAMHGLALPESTKVPLRVLVVDDNPGDARYIGFLLEGGPYVCASVNSYEDGLELIRQQTHDVYLIDYRLGNRTGLELIEEVSGAASGPFILVTGLDDPALDDLALSAGASDYLSKARMAPEDVTRSIRYAVETWRARRSAELDKERFRALYERQKDSQAETQRLGALARSVLDALQYPQAVISLDGHIIAVNHAWMGFMEEAGMLPNFGGVGADYLAMCRRGLVAEDFGGAVVVAGIEAVLAGDSERFRHNYSTHYGGSDRWFRSDVTPIPGTGAVVAHSDVTEERKARYALEDLIRAKDEFIASVSHELRTPLTAVVGLTQELSTGRVRPDEIPELQLLITQQAQEVSDIVEDLLVAARASADTITVTATAFKVRKELEAVVKPWLRGGANVIDLSAVDGELMGRGDPGRVRQIMRNLIANAIRYGGSPIAIEGWVAGAELKIAVRDHGGGIPLEAVDRMFEPYARLGGQIGLPSSVGLGLYVSRLLARMMGGDLHYSRDDNRTEFCLTLPVERRRAAEGATPMGRVQAAS